MDRWMISQIYCTGKSSNEGKTILYHLKSYESSLLLAYCCPFLIFFSGQATSYEFNKAACRLTPDPAGIPLNLWALDLGSSLIEPNVFNNHIQ